MKYNIIIAKLTAILFGYDMDAIGNFGYDIAWQNSYQHCRYRCGSDRTGVCCHCNG